MILVGFPGGSDSKESARQCKRHKFDLWVRKIPWRGKRQPTPVFLPGGVHGQRGLAGYSPRGPKNWIQLIPVEAELLLVI